MKIGIVGDVHLSQYSSIIRSNGQKYSKRIENIIKSINWAEEEFKNKGCDIVVYLGDTFDTPTLNQDEITSCKDIVWYDAPHYFLVGNHESNIASLKCSSTKVLEQDRHTIIDTSTSIDIGNAELVFIPYLANGIRKPLQEYLTPLKEGYKRIVFSHNDIKGIQYGKFESQDGFELDDITNNSDLYLNGHLHNGAWIVPNKVRNLGILSGKDFNEDANVYKHNIMILDTQTLDYEDVENPHAFNFLKVQIDSKDDFNKLGNYPHEVLSIKCEESLVPLLKDTIRLHNNIEEYKITTYSNVVLDSNEVSSIELNVNHLEQFSTFIMDNMKDSYSPTIIKEELEEVLK